MTLETWTEFFGWCSIINIVIYIIAFAALTLVGGFGIRINARIFHMSEDAIRKMTVEYLANYKLAITMLNVVPWLALTIMGTAV